MRDDLALIDTDVASILYRSRYFDRHVPPELATTLASRRLAITLVSLGEAHYGVRKRKWAIERSARLLAFYGGSFDVIRPNHDTAPEYGYLRAATEAVGRPIAGNDLWIAAFASANGLPLVTLNRRHFEPLTIFGLRLL